MRKFMLKLRKIKSSNTRFNADIAAKPHIQHKYTIDVHIYTIRLFDKNCGEPVKTGRFFAFFCKFTKKIINF